MRFAWQCSAQAGNHMRRSHACICAAPKCGLKHAASVCRSHAFGMGGMISAQAHSLPGVPAPTRATSGLATLLTPCMTHTVQHNNPCNHNVGSPLQATVPSSPSAPHQGRSQQPVAHGFTLQACQGKQLWAWHGPALGVVPVPPPSSEPPTSTAQNALCACSLPLRDSHWPLPRSA